MKSFQYVRMMLMLFVFATSSCWAGKVYKCTSNSGKVSFTNIQCPEADIYQKETIQLQSSTAESRRKRQIESKIYEKRMNDNEALKLRIKAKRLYNDASSKRRMRKSQRHALQEQAKSLERQADYLLGRRQTHSLSRTEQLENKVRELEDTISRTPTTIPTQPTQNNPQYVPSVNKWCQQQGGTMNCW